MPCNTPVGPCSCLLFTAPCLSFLKRCLFQPTPPGPNFCIGELMWAQGRPGLETMVTYRSFTLFDLLGLRPEDVAFLQDDVARYRTACPEGSQI